MKLIKNNKYKNRVTAGIGALVLSLGILTGCNNNNNNNNNNSEISYNEVVSPLQNSLEDVDYLSNYYNISDSELNTRINNLEIKHPNREIDINKLLSLAVKDKDGNYKTFYVLYINQNNKLRFYDIFTECFMFELDYSDFKYNEDNNGKYAIDCSKINTQLDYFDDKEILGIGSCYYAINFYIEYFQDIIDRYGKIDKYYTYDTVYQCNNSFNKSSYNVLDIAKIYSKYVVKEFQETSKELTLSSNNLEKVNNLVFSLDDHDYFCNYYNISDEEVFSRISNIDMKYPNKKVNSLLIFSLVLKDKNDDYKTIMLLSSGFSDDNNMVNLYDPFTEEVVCKINYDDLIISYTSAKYDVDTSKIIPCVDYLKDNKIISIGNCYHSITFFGEYFEEIIDKYGTTGTYNYNTISQCSEAYNHENEFYTVNELAYIYSKYVVSEFQVTSKELGVSSNNIKYKYDTVLGIDDDTLNERLSNVNINYEDEMLKPGDIFTLVLKDSNNNDKVMFARNETSDYNYFKLYDLYTDEYLCSLSVNNEDVELSEHNKVLNYGTDAFNDISSILDGYTIKEFGLIDYGLSYMLDNVDYYSKKDGIDYIVTDSCYNNLFINGKKDVVMSKLDYVKAYLSYIPVDFQIYNKDLNLENDKVLVK